MSGVLFGGALPRLALGSFFLLSACGPQPGDSDSESSTAASSTTGTTVTTSVTTGSADNPCAALPWHGCLPLGDCAAEPCGVAGAAYDADGCLRGGCGDDDDCYGGEVCHRPVDWGGCASSGAFCELDDVSMQCVCGGTDDCNGSYCVLAGTVPDPTCLEQTEQAPCLDLGCNEFVTTEAVVRGPMGCECTGSLGTCLFLIQGVTGEPAITPYYRDDGSNEVRLFPNLYTVPPIGWQQCVGNPGEPDACACASCP